MDIWYETIKWIARCYAALFIDELHVQGLENVPTGPKIFAANHPNTNNAMLLPLVLPDRLYFWVAAGAFKFPVWGWLLKGSRQIPVAPGNGRHILRAGEDVLARGESVVILPEGRTTALHDNREGGTGAVRLALRTNAPIVPVGFFVPQEAIKTVRISGRSGAQEGYFQVGGPCRIHFGQPYMPDVLRAGRSKAAAAREMTDQLMGRIRSLAMQAAAWSLS